MRSLICGKRLDVFVDVSLSTNVYEVGGMNFRGLKNDQ